MQGYTQRIVHWGLLLTAMLTPVSPPLSAGEGPRLELLTRDSYLPGIPLLLRVELRSPDGSLHRERWNAVARLRLEGQGASISVDEVLLRNGIGSALAGAFPAPYQHVHFKRLTIARHKAANFSVSENA